MREKIIYNEIEYSIQGLAKDLEVSPTTLRKYIEEENGDVNKAVQRILDKTIYIYKGTEYTSIFSLSEKTGINRRTLTDAIKERYREVRGKIEVDDIIEEYYAQNHKLFSISSLATFAACPPILATFLFSSNP